jgi:hypothetical protein
MAASRAARRQRGFSRFLRASRRFLQFFFQLFVILRITDPVSSSP